MSNELKLTCCHIGCEKLATHEIRFDMSNKNRRLEDYTHACADHLGMMLDDSTVQEAVKLVAPGDPTPVYV